MTSTYKQLDYCDNYLVEGCEHIEVCRTSIKQEAHCQTVLMLHVYLATSLHTLLPRFKVRTGSELVLHSGWVPEPEPKPMG